MYVTNHCDFTLQETSRGWSATKHNMSANNSKSSSSFLPSTCGLEDDHPIWVKPLFEYFRFESKETRSVGDGRNQNRKRVFYNLLCTVCETSTAQKGKNKSKEDHARISGNAMWAFVRHLNVSIFKTGNIFSQF